MVAKYGALKQINRAYSHLPPGYWNSLRHSASAALMPHPTV